MPKAIVMHKTGGPECLRFEEVTVGEPGPGQVKLRQSAVGLNYIDIYVRTGAYPLLQLPGTPGMEGCGTVTAVGPDVTDLKPGDRVAYGTALGAYAEERLAPADRMVKLPDGIDDRTGAAMMLKGMTAEYLLHRTTQVKPGDTILVQAAAGGVGLMLCAWARHIGATVIGTAGGPEKVELARAHGCQHPIDYTAEDFAARVKEITDGRGVDKVFDGIGKATFEGSFDSLAPMGHLVSFGQASGPVEPIAIAMLGQKSATLSRPSLFHYTARREDLQAIAGNLIDAVTRGIVKIEIEQTYPLADAAQAHRDLEARKTTGSTVMLVD